MARNICALTVILISALCIRLGAAENGTPELTTGTHFLVGFIHPDRAPGEPLPDSAYRVLVHASKGANITVDGRTISIDPGYTVEVKLPFSTVVDIRSDRPVSVWSHQAINGNGEQSLHLPVGAWGREYRAFAWWSDRHGLDSASMRYSSAKRLIIAAHDSTRVTVETPDGTIDSSLNAGQWWLVSERIDTTSLRSADSDPTGLLISADRPIGVISGHAKAGVLAYPDGLPMTGPYARPANRCRGNLHDAMFPTSMAGTEFVTLPISYTPTRERGLDLRDQGIGDDRGDVIRFIALSDSTVIQRIDSAGVPIQVAMLRKGASWMDTRMEHATVWRTSTPALCAQYGKSYGHITSQTTRPEDDPSTDAGMPLLMTIPSSDRWVSTAHFTTYPDMFNAVSVVARNEDATSLRLNGTPLATLAKRTPIPGSPYCSIRAILPQGAFTVHSESGKKFACWTYGSLDGYQLGRIYGSLTALDVRRQCDDSVDVYLAYAGDSATARGSITSIAGACSEIAMLFLDSAANLVSSRIGDDLAIRRKDPNANGAGRVVVVSTSGKTTSKSVEFSTTSVRERQVCENVAVNYSTTTGTISISRLDARPLGRTAIFTAQGRCIHESVEPSDAMQIQISCIAPGLLVVVVDNWVFALLTI